MSAVALRGEVERLPAAHPVLGPVTPLDLLNKAVSDGAGIEVMAKLMDLHERWEKGQARKAFDAAISAAKAKIPTITKNKRVAFESRKAGSAATDYKHETLDEIARVVTPILAEHGLSYRYRATSEVAQPITVTCIISHRDGHSEETTLIAGRDDSGNKNAIQQIGSTITYLQRYTLKAALGLAAAHDDDGRASSASEETITSSQVEELQQLIVRTGANLRQFLDLGKIERLEEMHPADFPSAVAMLRRKASQPVMEASR